MKTTQHSQTPKTVKSTRAKKVAPVESFDAADENDVFDEVMTVNSEKSSGMGSKVSMIAVVAVLVLAFVGFKFKYVLTPATVNGQPIYVWDYFKKLHTQFGQDEINSMTTELMIKQAIADANVSVSSDEVEKEVKNVEQEASSSGGLTAVLAAQHMTMDEFRTRIQLQLAVKKVLSSKIAVTDQEVDDTYKKNKDFYKGLPEAEAKKEVKQQLEDQKFQTEVSTWLSGVRSKAKVSIKFPGLTNPSSLQQQ